MFDPSRLLLCLAALTLFSLGCSPPQSGVVGCESGATQACDTAGGCAGTQTCTDGEWSACAPPAELCNGIDDDCDGEVDEDFADLGGACTPGRDACGTTGTWTCSSDGTSLVCAADPVDPQPETCNGIDDDCDGEIDNVTGLGDACSVGVGACDSAGTLVCDVATGGLVCDAVPGTPSAEVCNGIDDDCDGIVDNVDGLGDICRVGEGACMNEGTLVCDASGVGLTCSVTPGAPSPEVCNDIDDDCDGFVDNVEGLGDACSEGEGACNRPGTRVCDLTSGALVCDAIPGTPSPEVCNDIDDDCNGIKDDVPGVGDVCSVGVGECTRNGTRVCDATAGALVCDAIPGEPSTEVCNGLDDDCDTVIDNVEGVGEPCTEGVGACLRDGSRVCDVVAGALTCDAIPGTPSPEVCNGVDDDCNGDADDVDGIDDACTVGVGACERSGTLICGPSSEAPVCSVSPGAPSAEVCNGIDDDCDGTVDNVQFQFAMPVNYPAELNCMTSAVGDLDGDNLQDVVCAPATVDIDNPDTRLFVYRNLGNGSFDTVQYLPPVVAPFRAQSRIALGDLDGDGDLDIVAVGETMRAQVYINAGNGTFAPPYEAFQFTTDGEPGTEGLLLHDFDGDGDLDIATTLGSIRTPERRLVLSMNDGSAGFGPPIIVDGDALSATDIYAADVGNNGDLDLVVVGLNEIRLYRPTASGSFEPPVTVVTFPEPLSRGHTLLTDLNADGYPDLLIPDAGFRLFIPGTGSGFGSIASVTVPGTEMGVAVGQLDCDPTPEVVTLAANVGAWLYVLRDPPTLEHTPVPGQVYGYTVELIDLDGDGDLDVVYGGIGPGLNVLIRN